MTIRKRVVGIILAVITALMLLFPLSAYAIIEPDTPAAINAVYIYEGELLEDGDCGILIDYFLDYAALPTETATESWIAILIDTDGTTQLKSAVPYSFNDKGYGRGLIWMYFTAAEVTAAGLDSTQIALYSMRLCGNPTLAWTDIALNPITPPITTSAISQWNTTGDMSTLLGLRVLYYAGILETTWGGSTDLVEMTSVGNRLTTTDGIEYFENTITGLRTMCPQVFSSSSVDPSLDDLDYETEFGATLTSAVVAGSPITLAEGANAEVSTGAGTATLVLNPGTSGTVVGAVVNGSPVTIVSGTNTVTLTGAGAFTVTVNLVDTTSGMDDAISGTGLDLTALGALFGWSRWMISGVVWVILSAIICGYFVSHNPQRFGGSAGASKLVFPLLMICTAGGLLLGLLKPVVGGGILVGLVGLYVGYILFLRNASA